MSAIPDVNFSLVASLGNRLLGQLNALREVAPIYWSEYGNAWIVTGHAEARAAFLGEFPLSNDRSQIFKYLMPDEKERERSISQLMRYFPNMLVNLDPPKHARLRRLMGAAFGRRVVEVYRPFASRVITQVLDRQLEPFEVEFMDQIARPITGLNIIRIMGLEDEQLYLPKLKAWAYAANTGGTNPSPDSLRAMEPAFVEMAAAFQRVVDARRAKPTSDFVSLLVQAGEDGDRMNDDEIIGNLILILIAGYDTTLNTMTLSVDALARNRDAREYMRANPEQSVNAILELSRVIAMSTQQPRIVIADFEWGGHQIKRGQVVHIMTAAANRDPRVFSEPERLDFTRDQKDNLTFGPGVHHCIGHLLAKMQLEEFFAQFLERFDRWESLDERLQFGAPLAFRGPVAVHLRLHSRITS